MIDIDEGESSVTVGEAAASVDTPPKRAELTYMDHATAKFKALHRAWSTWGGYGTAVAPANAAEDSKAYNAGVACDPKEITAISAVVVADTDRSALQSTDTAAVPDKDNRVDAPISTNQVQRVSVAQSDGLTPTEAAAVWLVRLPQRVASAAHNGVALLWMQLLLAYFWLADFLRFLDFIVGLVRVTDPLTGVLYALATEVRAGRTQLSIARGRMLQGAEGGGSGAGAPLAGLINVGRRVGQAVRGRLTSTAEMLFSWAILSVVVPGAITWATLSWMREVLCSAASSTRSVVGRTCASVLTLLVSVLSMTPLRF